MDTKASPLVPASVRDLTLPREVSLLPRREREIAAIVYGLRSATAEEVRDLVSQRISNAAVRSMLNRLVAKGILERTLSGSIFVYLGALTITESRSMALKLFADDYFDGSVKQAAATMAKLLKPRN